MKIMYFVIVALTMTVVLSIHAQGIFLKAQSSGWYPLFLKPVVKEITIDNCDKKILDIGTGPGKLLQLLIAQDSTLQLTGIDIDSAMIEEARKNFTHPNVSFEYESKNEKLVFDDHSFDIVTFCSVLFLLDNNTKTMLMDEAVRVLKPNGRVVVLTPSGMKTIISSFTEVRKYPYAKTNWTFIAWKAFTTRSARRWQKDGWLSDYSNHKGLGYSFNLTFNNNASMEIITNNSN